MKKTILALAVFMITGLTSAFANKGEAINQNAIASFNKDFISAKNVSWQQSKDFIKATFSMNNHIMFAYYNQTGELIAVVRNILSTQLPISLLTDMKKKYNDHWVSDLFEVATENQTMYYVTLENSDEKLVLKSDGYDQWSVYNKEKKNSINL